MRLRGDPKAAREKAVLATVAGAFLVGLALLLHAWLIAGLGVLLVLLSISLFLSLRGK